VGEDSEQVLAETADDMRYVKDGDVEYQLDQLLNQGLEFNDNMRGALVEHDLVEGDNEIRHALGFVPYGAIVVLKSGPGEIYGTRLLEWTNEIMFLRCDVSSLRVRLFVM
jgi:hypothetical protein